MTQNISYCNYMTLKISKVRIKVTLEIKMKTLANIYIIL